MRGLSVFLAGTFLITALTLLSVQSTTSAANPTPTRTPSATRTDAPALVDLNADHIYFHSTGLFSIPRLVGWEPRLANDTVHDPTLSTDLSPVYVSCINESIPSVV